MTSAATEPMTHRGAAILTRRRDQRGYKPGMPCPDQLVGGVLFCGSAEAREEWIRRLSKAHPLRFNHFVCFRDVQSPWALQFGHHAWRDTPAAHVYVCR